MKTRNENRFSVGEIDLRRNRAACHVQVFNYDKRLKPIQNRQAYTQ